MNKEIEIKAAEDKEESGKTKLIAISSNFSKQEDLSSANFEIDNRTKVVKWGKNNLLPDFLIKVSKTKSTKHAAIISRKCKMIAGSGFVEPESQAAKDFIKNRFSKHDLNEISKMCANDYEVLNMYALGIRWNSDKTRIAAIDYIPAHKVRKSIVSGLWKISDNWEAPNQKSSNTQIKQEFNSNPLPEEFETMSDKEKKFELNQILVYKNTQIAAEAYPSPTYAAGLDWILADASIATFTLNMIKKNFTGGYHINIATGIPEEDERKSEKKKFKKEYAGESGESIIITFSEPDSPNVPTLNPLPSTGNEEIYNETEKRAQENIFIVHEVTNPALFGIRIAGELGGKNNLQESLEIFQVVYVDQRQNDIESSFNLIGKINLINEELQLKTFSLEVDDDDSTNSEGKQLAKKLSKLDQDIRGAVLARLTDEEILSIVGIKKEKESSSDVTEAPTEEKEVEPINENINV